MLRRAGRSLFVARNRLILLQSERAAGKGATNSNIVGSNRAQVQPQSVDPAGTGPLQFGKNENESSVFRQAAGAWDTMRKVGNANPIESNIERFEDRYQTEGTGEQQQQTTANAPSLWERAKDAVQAVKDTISSTTKNQNSDQKANLAQDEDLIVTLTRTQTTIGDRTYSEEQTTIKSLQSDRPGFADDATGHRPWNWEMAQDSLRNSTDGMGIIENRASTTPTQNATQSNTDFSKTQNQENVKQAWQNTKQAAKENWEDTKDAAKRNWDDAKESAKDLASESWQDAKDTAKQNFQQAANAVNAKIDQTKENLKASTDAVKENIRERREEVQQSWDDTKEVAKDGFREAGNQLKQGFADLKQNFKNLGARDNNADDNNTQNFASPTRNTRQEVKKGSSSEHGEKNAQVPRKQPTRYGDWEYGGRASDF